MLSKIKENKKVLLKETLIASSIRLGVISIGKILEIYTNLEIEVNLINSFCLITGFRIGGLLNKLNNIEVKSKKVNHLEKNISLNN